MIWEAALPGPRIVHLKQHLLLKRPANLERRRSDFPVTGKDQSEDRDDDQVYQICSVAALKEALRSEEAMRREEETWDTFNHGRWPEVWNKPQPLFEFFCWRSTCPPPLLLRVCYESFVVASKIYSQAFGTPAAFPETWFSFQKDILYFNVESFLYAGYNFDGQAKFKSALERDISTQEMRRVDNLALFLDQLGGARWQSNYEIWLCGILELFMNVKNLTVVPEHYKGLFYQRLKKSSNPRDDESLVFIEPFDIDHACNFYGLNHPDIFNGELIYNPQLLNVDMDLLDRYRLGGEDFEDLEYEIKFNMPNVDEEVVSSAAMRAKLEELKKDFEAATGRTSDWHQLRNRLYPS